MHTYPPPHPSNKLYKMVHNSSLLLSPPLHLINLKPKMRRLLILFLLALPTHIFATPIIKSYSDDKLPWPPVKHTKLNFFVHTKLTPPNESIVEVTRPAENDLPFDFGQIKVFDEIITRDPNRLSPIWGRSQGFLIMSDLNAYAWVVSATIIFSNGLYAGSTLVLLGRYESPLPMGILSIVGGTGIFSYAQGICTFKIIGNDPLYSDIEDECDVYYRSDIVSDI